MQKIKHIDLFSGIGGFALAADRVFGEVEHIFCDNEPFAQEVLKKHWPNSKIYGDIRQFTADTSSERLCEYSEGTGLQSEALGTQVWMDEKVDLLTDGDIRTLTNTNDAGLQEEGAEQQTARGTRNTPFLLTGGFPCQPFSQAGRRKGTEDERYLWPEMLRVIREFQPTWVIAENVRGLLTQGGGVVFEQVCTDLEDAGYEVQPIVIPAVAVNAPHRRDRVWFIAHRNDTGSGTPTGDIIGHGEKDSQEWEHALDRSCGHSENDTNTASDGCERGREKTEGQSSKSDRARSNERPDWNKHWHEVALTTCNGRVDDGVPRRLDRSPRLKALGNAIVPQVAEEIMQAIKHATRQN